MGHRILLVAKPWKGGLAQYIYQTLQEMVPPSTQVEWIFTYPLDLPGRILYRCNRKLWKRRVQEKIAASRYDAALYINHMGDFADPGCSAGNVLWLTDDPRPLLERLAPYGRVFISDGGYREETAAALGERFAGILPFACHPAVHRPPGISGERRGLCFIANRDPKRYGPLQELLAAGVDITTYGNSFLHGPLFWRHPLRFRPPVPIPRMGEVYGRYQGSLNIHARVVRHGTNMRTFECAGYGIPQVVEYRPGLEELFVPEEEILVYRSSAEMISQIRRLLGDPVLAGVLMNRAALRVARDHTYRHRVATLLDGLVAFSAAP
jgi:hypothetical protein